MDPITESEVESFDHYLGDFVGFAEDTTDSRAGLELFPSNTGSSHLNGRRGFPLLPSSGEAATAKKAWLPIIRRCTEAVSERKGHLRPSDAASPNRGRIHVEYQSAYRFGKLSGYELDISDKMCLLLLSRDEPERNGAAKNGVIESSTPILWTEIANIRFEVERPLLSTPHSANAS